MLTNWIQVELANCKWTKILVVRRLTYSAWKRCPLDVPELARLLPQKLQTTLHSTATVTQHQSIIALACHLVHVHKGEVFLFSSHAGFKFSTRRSVGTSDFGACL
jgi:hypothetical protein